MAVSPVILKTNPHRPVDFKESSVAKVLESSGNLNVETKEDGCQLNFVVDYNGTNADVEFLSREGKRFNGLTQLGIDLTEDARWPKFFNPHLDGGLFRDEGGFLLQAEILVDGKVCAEIAGDLRRMEPMDLKTLEIVVFDIIPLDAVLSGKDYEVFQEVRRGHLMVQLEALKSRFPEIRWRLVDSTPVFTMIDLQRTYEDIRDQGKEGGVAKDPLGYWKRGKKTGQWKLKASDSCDGTVTGLMWGTPGLSNEGKVIGFTVLTEHGVEVEAGGITEAQKAEYTANVLSNPEHYSGWTVQISYMERLPSGSYRHPNFSHFRGITDPLIKE